MRTRDTFIQKTRKKVIYADILRGEGIIKMYPKQKKK